MMSAFEFLRKYALASPNKPSTHSRRPEWSEFDSVLALFADSLSNRIFCLNKSVSCSIGMGPGVFLSPSAPAPCTAMRITRRSSRSCFVVSLACARAGPSLPNISCSSWSCFRNFSTVSVDFWSFFSRSLSFAEALLYSDSFCAKSCSGVVTFVLVLPCADWKSAARESLPSQSILSAAASRSARGSPSGTPAPNFSKFPSQGEHMDSALGDFAGIGSGKGRIHCGQKERF